MTEQIRIKFEGGLAETGKLHFYEYSRSQYATARFITTIEHFRRTGIVADRVTSSTRVDIIVQSPEKGSFIEDVFVSGLKEAAASLVSLPLSSLISYVWHLMVPRAEKTDAALSEIARIRLAEIEASVALERERTAQHQSLERIVAGARATAQEGHELFDWAIQSPNVAVGRLGLSPDEMQGMRNELQAEDQREREFSDHTEGLTSLDEDTMNKLTSRLRPMVPEMALPLRRSAKEMSLSHGSAATTYARITPEVVRSIQERQSEDIVVEVTGHIKSYDRDAGVGKVRSNDLDRVLNFVVPPNTRQVLRDDILEAMRREEVTLICRRVVDRSGLPTSLILISIDFIELIDETENLN